MNHKLPPSQCPLHQVQARFFLLNFARIRLKRLGFLGCGATLGPGAFGVSVGVAVGPFEAASAFAFAWSSPSVDGACIGFCPASALGAATAPESTPALASSNLPVVPDTIGFSAPALRASLNVVPGFTAGMVLLTLPYCPPPTVTVNSVGVLLTTLPD